MERPFAVFDIDGTLVRWQLYHAIVDALVKAGDIDPKSFDAVRTARMTWKRRASETSFKEYEEEIVKLYDEALMRISTDEFLEAAHAAFEEYKQQTYIYTRDFIRQLQGQDYLLFAISGSQTEIVGMLAAYYGFDDFVGTNYERKNGRFTGQKELASLKKPELLDQLVRKHKATYRRSIAVGDSESDITMLERVEQPVAFNPTKALFEHARQNGWKVVVERKNMWFELENEDGSYILAQTNA